MRNYPKRSKYRAHHRERSTYTPNTSGESHTPDPRTRAQAQKNLDKYLNLARDASSSGDRVLAEHYYQHADHYYRMAHAGLPPAAKGPSSSPQTSSENQNSVVIDVEAEPIRGEEGHSYDETSS